MLRAFAKNEYLTPREATRRLMQPNADLAFSDSLNIWQAGMWLTQHFGESIVMACDPFWPYGV